MTPASDVRLAILILAHRAPDQVGRLVRHVVTTDTSVIVHVDARVDLRPFERACEGTGAELLRDRTRVTWGGWSQVAAALSLVRAAIRADVSHAVLISGQDYPIRPVAHLVEHVARHPGAVMLDARPVDTAWPQAAFRYRRYHFVDQVETSRLAGGWRSVQRVANRAFGERQAPSGLVVHGGASWWLMPRPALELLERAGHDKRTTRFFRMAAMPDESFVHSVIMGSPLGADVLPPVTYTRFDPAQGGMHPVVWTREDLAELMGSGHFFARKFDVDVDATILDLLDAQLT